MQLSFRSLLITIFLASGLCTFAQQSAGQTGLIKGRLISKVSNQPLVDMQITLPLLKQQETTDLAGVFSFSRVPYGTYNILIGGQSLNLDSLTVTISAEVLDLGDIPVVVNDSVTLPQGAQAPAMALEDNTISSDDDGVKESNSSGLIYGSRDPFLSAAAYVFGPMRFQPRGYRRTSEEVQINGSPMNDVETGGAFWSQWGGLNDIFRSSTSYGLQPSENSFGGINGSLQFDATAAAQRKQTRITYGLSNRQYNNKISITHNSGVMKNGWSYSLSLSKRWAKEGYVPGTFYDGYSYYAGVSKKFAGGKHQINLTTFGVPTRIGKSSLATQETYDLAGDHFYNPNWGYQNGEKRNARVSNQFQPVTILSYDFKPAKSLRWTTSISNQFGKYKSSGIDWYNAANPYPDYYRYLPSYYTLNGDDASHAEFLSPEGRQVNWDELYHENYINNDSIVNANGIAGNTVKGKRSVYVVGDDVDDIRKYTFNTTLQKVIDEHLTVQGGVQFISQRTESYRELTDLLGGDFYVNLNQFAAQQNVPNINYNQYDLNDPNRPVHVGDKYNYDFIERSNKGFAWLQGVATYNKLNLFLSARGGYNDFSREGLYRNGLFSTSSYGKSVVERFMTYSVKGGMTYKMDGRNYLFANLGYSQDAPTFDNTFISARSRNQTVDNPTVEKTSTIEAGYLMRTPKYNLRAVGYATSVRDAAQIMHFYNDDPAFQTFVQYVLQGISATYTGLELAGEMKVHPSLSVSAVAAIGQAYYTSNPKIGIYRDNDTAMTSKEREVYIKNYYLSVGPQSSYTLGLHYGPKKYWNANLNFNYFDRNYIGISPDQHSVEAVEGTIPGTAQYQSILDQEKLPSAFTINISVSKSVLLSKISRSFPSHMSLYVNAGISNILDSKDIKSGGYEQLRYDFADQNPDKFPSKYFYSYGRNFFLNLSLQF